MGGWKGGDEGEKKRCAGVRLAGAPSGCSPAPSTLSRGSSSLSRAPAHHASTACVCPQEEWGGANDDPKHKQMPQSRHMCAGHLPPLPHTHLMPSGSQSLGHLALSNPALYVNGAAGAAT